jgi:hypothetical protein
VEDEPHSHEGPAHCHGVPDVGIHDLDVEPAQVLAVTPGLGERNDRGAAPEQLARDGRADEPSGTGDRDAVARTDGHGRLCRRGRTVGSTGRGAHAGAITGFWPPRRSALFAIVVPNSLKRPDPWCASCSTSSRAPTK